MKYQVTSIFNLGNQASTSAAASSGIMTQKNVAQVSSAGYVIGRLTLALPIINRNSTKAIRKTIDWNVFISPSSEQHLTSSSKCSFFPHNFSTCNQNDEEIHFNGDQHDFLASCRLASRLSWWTTCNIWVDHIPWQGMANRHRGLGFFQILIS